MPRLYSEEHGREYEAICQEEHLLAHAGQPGKAECQPSIPPGNGQDSSPLTAAISISH